jgi:hypothetical protein
MGKEKKTPARNYVVGSSEYGVTFVEVANFLIVVVG